MSKSYCEAPSPTFPSPGCCGRTLTVSPEPECQNCGQMPTLDSPHARVAHAICMGKTGHRGKHTWEKYGYGN